MAWQNYFHNVGELTISILHSFFQVLTFFTFSIKWCRFYIRTKVSIVKRHQKYLVVSNITGWLEILQKWKPDNWFKFIFPEQCQCNCILYQVLCFTLLMTFDWKLNDLRPTCTVQKMKLSIKDFFRFLQDLVTFTEEILNGKLHFLGSDACRRTLRYANLGNVVPLLFGNSLFINDKLHTQSLD